MLKEIESLIRQWRDPAFGFIEAHSSGSTGTPKPILLPKTLVRDSARRTIDFFHLDSQSRLHLCLPLSAIAGKMQVIRALECGGRLTFETPSNRPTLNGLEDNSPISLLPLVPSQLGYVLDNLENLPPIENILVGGSSIPDSLVARAAKSSVPVFESYGMTETASHIALRRVTAPQAGFLPLAGIKVEIDSRGCLAITLPGEKTLHTNDLATIHADGSFSILGRLDNVIISGGVKISPEEVEGLIAPLLEGKRYLISSERDEKWGERVVLLLESAQISADEEQRLMKELKTLLAPAQCPKKIICLGRNFATTHSGKIKRPAPGAWQ